MLIRIKEKRESQDRKSIYSPRNDFDLSDLGQQRGSRLFVDVLVRLVVRRQVILSRRRVGAAGHLALYPNIAVLPLHVPAEVAG